MFPDPAKPPRRLLYVVNEDWAFLLNRLPMARAAQKAGFEVHVATRVNDGARAIEAEGFTLHPIPLQRGGISPLSAIPAVIAYNHFLHNIKELGARMDNFAMEVAAMMCVGICASWKASSAPAW